MNPLPSLNPTLVGKWNERQILRTIQTQGAMSRAEIVRRLGLSAPTVSKAVASLLQAGLLEELAAPVVGRGRPAPVLRPAVERAQVLGVVIDAGFCSVIPAGLDGALHQQRSIRLETPASYPELLDRLVRACDELIARAGVSTFGLGVSLPGLIDTRTGTGVLSPNVPMTNRHRPAADLAARLGIESVLIQEAHALALGERAYGEAAGLRDFAVVDIGVGVGLAVMAQGRLLQGHSGMAGELGHLTVQVRGGVKCGCGNHGCLETLVSDRATAARVAKLRGQPTTIEEAFACLQADPRKYAAVYDEFLEYLSVGLAAAINLYNPGAIFLHTRWLEVNPELLGRLRQATAARALGPAARDTELRPARSSKQHGAIAAIVQNVTNALASELD